MATERPGEIADILLVEPNPGDTRLFSENFIDAKFANSIHAVTDGESALDFLYQRGEYSEVSCPDIVLLDPVLPGNGGSDVLAELKNEPALRDIIVVLMTSSEAEEAFLESTEIEPDTCIEKPIEPDEFLAFAQSVEDFWLAVVRKPPQS